MVLALRFLASEYGWLGRILLFDRLVWWSRWVEWELGSASEEKSAVTVLVGNRDGVNSHDDV